MILCISVLLFCVYQDLRYRGIHWLAFPLLLGSLIWIRQGNLSLDILWNALLLGGLMLLLSSWVALREGAWTSITKGHFSWGDILFLLVMTPLFDPLSYAAFITIASIFSVIMHLLASLFKPQKNIPFAGYSALISIWFVIDPQFLYRFLYFYEF